MQPSLPSVAPRDVKVPARGASSAGDERVDCDALLDLVPLTERANPSQAVGQTLELLHGHLLLEHLVLTPPPQSAAPAAKEPEVRESEEIEGDESKDDRDDLKGNDGGKEQG